MPTLLATIPTLAITDEEKVIGIFAIMGLVAVIWIITAAIHYTLKAKYQEQTKREIAAYVAEGSIAPDDAARLLASDDEVRKKIADGVAWGTIKAKDAEALIGSSVRPNPSRAT